MVSGLFGPESKYHGVVSPPLPMPRLEDAKGTGAALSSAFGTRLNPELRAPGVTNTRDLQGFTCLYDWLLDRSQVDPTGE